MADLRDKPGDSLCRTGDVVNDRIEVNVRFRLWNEFTGTGIEAVHAEPVLLAVRLGDQPFYESLTCTPEGRRRRPEDDWDA